MDSNGIAEKQCLEGDKDLQFLMNGGDLLKVRSGSWKKTRYYKLQEDCKTLWHESKKTLKSKQTFCVEDIEEVRTGRQTDGLRKYTEESVEGRAFSILFKSQQKGLDLIASSEEEAKKWVGGLEKVISNIKNLTPQKKTEHWIYSCMRKADKNFDNKISQKELKSFLRDINIEVDEDYAEMLFQKCDKSKCGFLEGKEIKHFYEILTQREEIEVIYGEYAKTDGLMSAADLLNFLLNEQREDASQNDALQLIEKYELDENAKAKQQMTKDGFLMYLHQPEGLIFNPAHKSVYQDMKQPLNHYFISSSHNTYLLEDQLKGPSSTEAYIKALLKGCRCVEMDCWDGSDGEPVIYHGYTLTSKILFKDVIKAIKEYAFKTTEYPVILSLENHCSVEQQKIMAQHLISILGSTLVTKPLGDQMPTCLPSPEELKGRFIVKGKRLDKLEDMFSEESKTAEEDSVTEEEDDEGDEEDQEKKSSKTKLLKLAKELSDIVIYCKSVHFRGFEDSRDKQSFYEMASFKEGKAVKLAEEAGVMSCSDTTQAMKHINTCQEMQTWGPFFVISAQQLPKVSKRESSIVDPIVKVQIYGVPTDMTVVETQYIENNGFNPMWNENFQFNVRVPDLALVRFLIEDYDSSSNNEFIGQYTLPFNCLKNGYHISILYHLSSAGLFVHIMVVDAE
uniref:Phosphoinositide phospholipase C n=1 Tax=Sinocyclocheilus rhinocerous TaxID=307959 RepID=A0A673H4Y8_9TELE